MRKYSLKISGIHFDSLRSHLFPNDGLEAITFGLGGQLDNSEETIITLHKLYHVAHVLCKRTNTSIVWPGKILADLLSEARRRGLSVIKFHSHPLGYENFSENDNQSDHETFYSVSSWVGNDKRIVSVIMLPDGRMFGRSVHNSGFESLSKIAIAGDDIYFWYSSEKLHSDREVFNSQKQLFGRGTIEKLSQLRIGVVGCSGTGSIVIELLARLGVGSLILVDHDTIEKRNLNRILNSKKTDIDRPKVEILAEAIKSIGIGTNVLPLSTNIFNPKTVKEIAKCDIVFGCMDTAEGRQILNRIASFYLSPYFDLGVHLKADGEGGISEASGVVHYLQPGRSSLLSRRAYTRELIRAENLHRTNPVEYAKEFKAGYIEGVDEESPAVISINSTISSLAINEFLARILPYRSCLPVDCAITRFNFMESSVLREEEGRPCPSLAPLAGRGDIEPLLSMPSLTE